MTTVGEMLASNRYVKWFQDSWCYNEHTIITDTEQKAHIIGTAIIYYGVQACGVESLTHAPEAYFGTLGVAAVLGGGFAYYRLLHERGEVNVLKDWKDYFSSTAVLNNNGKLRFGASAAMIGIANAVFSSFWPTPLAIANGAYSGYNSGQTLVNYLLQKLQGREREMIPHYERFEAAEQEEENERWIASFEPCLRNLPPQKQTAHAAPKMSSYEQPPLPSVPSSRLQAALRPPQEPPEQREQLPLFSDDDDLPKPYEPMHPLLDDSVYVSASSRLSSLSGSIPMQEMHQSNPRS